MNYQLSIVFANPSTLEAPNFTRVFTRLTIDEIVQDANDFLATTKTRLLSYVENTTIGVTHVSDAIENESIFQIAICSNTNEGPLQIMEFKKTDSRKIGEDLVFVSQPNTLTVETPSKLETKTKFQDALALTLTSVPSFNNGDDILLLTKQIDLAKKEYGRNLRYAAIDKLQDIRERHDRAQNLLLDTEIMFDEMIGALLNLKS